MFQITMMIISISMSTVSQVIPPLPMFLPPFLSKTRISNRSLAIHSSVHTIICSIWSNLYWGERRPMISKSIRVSRTKLISIKVLAILYKTTSRRANMNQCKYLIP